MKLFLYSFILLLLTGCLNSEERFTCQSKFGSSNEGLIIKNNKAHLGSISDMKFCEKHGTVSFYSSDCNNSKKYTSISLDTVSYDLTLSIKSELTSSIRANLNLDQNSSSNSYYQCKQVN
jgi:hypothetical protein